MYGRTLPATDTFLARIEYRRINNASSDRYARFELCDRVVRTETMSLTNRSDCNVRNLRAVSRLNQFADRVTSRCVLPRPTAAVDDTV